jgi:hypothetical protein
MQWVNQMGPDLRLLLGYMLYKADLVDDATEHLTELLDNPKYLQQHPGALYYLGTLRVCKWRASPCCRSHDRVSAVAG